mgnify:CR=1 FL=1
MSKHNYSQYSKNKQNYTKHEPAKSDEFVTTVEAPENALEVKMEHVPVAEPVVINEVPKAEVKACITGIVANCAKLNVRSKPAVDADVVAVLDSNSEVEIDKSRSTSEWYKVCTAN